MPDKQKSSQKSRNAKTSKGEHGGGGRVRLTDLEKVLLVSGGIGHRLRGKGVAPRPFKKSSSRIDSIE